MASSTYEQLRAEAQVIAPWLIPIISTLSSNGGAQTIVDATLFQNTNANFLSQNSGVGMWIFRPDATAAADRERRIGGSTPVTLASGTVTHDGAAYTNNPASAEQYEIHAIQPKISFNILLAVMRNFLQATYGPLAIFTDADMEETGTSNYTISGAGALSKVATAVNVHSGSQSLLFDAAAAGEYVEGPSVRVQAGQQYFASSIFRVNTAGGTGSLAVWDKTNDAEIGSRASHSHEGFNSVERTFTPPAGCEEVALRVYATIATDDIYIDCFHGPYKSSDLLINAPSYLTRASFLRKVCMARYLQGSSNVYDANSRTYDDFLPRDFHLRADHHHANPYRFEFRRFLPMEEMWIETVRPASDITTFAFTAAGETSPTTSIPRRLLALAWVEQVCKHVLSYRPDDAEVKATRTLVIEELGPLMSDYQRDLETPTYPPPNPVRNMARA